MPQQRGTNWTVMIAGGALVLSFGSTVINALINSSDKLEKRVGQLEQDLTWKYLSKEVAAKDLNFINQSLLDLKIGKTDKDVYEQRMAQLERMIVFQRERILELERRGK